MSAEQTYERQNVYIQDEEVQNQHEIYKKILEQRYMYAKKF